MNTDHKYVREKDNWTNNKWDAFYNSVYVVWDFFNNFYPISKKSESWDINGSTHNYDKIFLKLRNKIKWFLLEEKHRIIRCGIRYKGWCCSMFGI